MIINHLDIFMFKILCLGKKKWSFYSKCVSKYDFCMGIFYFALVNQQSLTIVVFEMSAPKCFNKTSLE